ncbi:MAG: hypothetical protein Q8O31_00795 [Rhodocyclaceae bacterium]|nr:hypothetical protein [Rhodocyclaceae bacterium]
MPLLPHWRNVRFNQAQKDAIAKFLENLATASAVGVIIGGLVDRKVGWESAVMLAVIGLFALVLSLRIRSDKGDGNGH